MKILKDQLWEDPCVKRSIQTPLFENYRFLSFIQFRTDLGDEFELTACVHLEPQLSGCNIYVSDFDVNNRIHK
jgi:hypothetical protein